MTRRRERLLMRVELEGWIAELWMRPHPDHRSQAGVQYRYRIYQPGDSDVEWQMFRWRWWTHDNSDYIYETIRQLHMRVYPNDETKPYRPLPDLVAV